MDIFEINRFPRQVFYHVTQNNILIHLCLMGDIMAHVLLNGVRLCAREMGINFFQ